MPEEFLSLIQESWGETEVRVLDVNNILKLVKLGKIDSLSTVAAVMLAVQLSPTPNSDIDSSNY